MAIDDDPYADLIPKAAAPARAAAPVAAAVDDDPYADLVPRAAAAAAAAPLVSNGPTYDLGDDGYDYQAVENATGREQTIHPMEVSELGMLDGRIVANPGIRVTPDGATASALPYVSPSYSYAVGSIDGHRPDLTPGERRVRGGVLQGESAQRLAGEPLPPQGILGEIGNSLARGASSLELTGAAAPAAVRLRGERVDKMKFLDRLAENFPSLADGSFQIGPTTGMELGSGLATTAADIFQLGDRALERQIDNRQVQHQRDVQSRDDIITGLVDYQHGQAANPMGTRAQRLMNPLGDTLGEQAGSLVHTAANDPAAVISALGAILPESLLQSLPTIGGGALGGLAAGPAGAVAGASAAGGVSGAAMQYVPAISDYLQQNHLAAGQLNNPKILAAALDYAEKQSQIGGLTEAVAGGIAGRGLVPERLISSLGRREAVNELFAQPLAQGTIGAGGQVAQQRAAGQDVNLGQVLGEFLGEAGMGPLEAVPGMVSRVREHRAPGRITEPEVQQMSDRLGEIQPKADAGDLDAQAEVAQIHTVLGGHGAAMAQEEAANQPGVYPLTDEKGQAYRNHPDGSLVGPGEKPDPFRPDRIYAPTLGEQVSPAAEAAPSPAIAPAAAEEILGGAAPDVRAPVIDDNVLGAFEGIEPPPPALPVEPARATQNPPKGGTTPAGGAESGPVGVGPGAPAAPALRNGAEDADLESLGDVARRGVNVASTADDVPVEVRDRMGGDLAGVEGFYDPDTGEVTVIESNLAPRSSTGMGRAERKRWVVAHEKAGHFGLRGAAVSGQGRPLGVVLEEAGSNPTVSALADAIAGDDQGRTAGEKARRPLLVEEALSELAAATETGNWKHIEQRYGIKVPAAQREGVRAMIARLYQGMRRAFGLKTANDAQVREILQGASRYAREGDVEPTSRRGRDAKAASKQAEAPSNDQIAAPEPAAMALPDPDKLDLDAPNYGLGELPRNAGGQAIIDSLPGGTTDGIDTPQRAAMREKIVEDAFESAEPVTGRKPVAYVMGGGGASGKGTLLNLLRNRGSIPEASATVNIDPDAIKAELPEYGGMIQAGDARAAATVHEESSQLAGQIRKRAIEGKYDVVLDRTLGNAAKALAELRELKAAGYEVRLYGVTVDPSVAIPRAIKRARRSGRYVPLSELVKAHKGFAAAFEQYAGIADHAELFENSGEAPVQIAGTTDGALVAHDQAAYNTFRNRSQINEQAGTLRSLQGHGANQPSRVGESTPAARPAGTRKQAAGAGQRKAQVAEDSRPAASRAPDLRDSYGNINEPSTAEKLRADARETVEDLLSIKSAIKPGAMLASANRLRSIVFDSMQSRARDLEAQFPQSKALRQLFDIYFEAPGYNRLVPETLPQATEARAHTFLARVERHLEASGMRFGQMTKLQNTKLRNALLGVTPVAQQEPAIRRAAERIRQEMTNQREDAVAAGVDIGEVRDIGYLTRLYDEDKIKGDEAGFLRDAARHYQSAEFPLEVGTPRDVLYGDGTFARFVSALRSAAVGNPRLTNSLDVLRQLATSYRNSSNVRDEAAQMQAIIQDVYSEVARDWAGRRAQSWLHAIRTPDISRGFNGLLESGAPVTRGRTLSGAADVGLQQWMRTDLREIMQAYIGAMAGKVEEARRIGTTPDYLKGLLEQAGREGVSSEGLEETVRVLGAVTGSRRSNNPTWQTAQEVASAWTYLALLGRGLFASLYETAAFSLRTGQLRHAISPLIIAGRALSAPLGNTTNTELRRLAVDIGVNGHQAVEDAMMATNAGGDVTNKLVRKTATAFFRGIWLSQLTEAQRAYGVGASVGYLKALARQYKETHGVGAAGVLSSPASVYFNELGIADHDLFADWILQQGARPAHSELFGADGRPTPRGHEFMVATRRLVNQSIQNVRPEHRTEWQNSSGGRIFGAIMGYSMAAYTNIIRREFNLQRTLLREHGTGVAGMRAVKFGAAAAAMYVNALIVSTVREALFNQARFEDKDEEEVLKELAGLAATRTFGFGTLDPIIQLLSSLKYRKSFAQTAAGATLGTALQDMQTIAEAFSSDTNSPTTDTAEYKAMEAVYRSIVTPLLNIVLSRVPYLSGVAIPVASGSNMRKRFADLFYTRPEARSDLDDDYNKATKDVKAAKDRVEVQLGELPKSQWAGQLRKLKAEFPTLLQGLSLEVYANTPENAAKGRAGQPKTDDEGNPELRFNAPRSGDGSLYGELEGYPTGKGKKSTAGLEDRLKKSTAAINLVRKQQDATIGDLVELTEGMQGEDIEKLRAQVAAGNGKKLAGSRLRNAVLEDMLASRRKIKRAAVLLIEKAKKGGKIPRGEGARILEELRSGG